MPLGMEVGLGLRDFVFDGDPAPPARKGHSSPPRFGSCPMWPRSPISATAELVEICERTDRQADAIIAMLRTLSTAK